MSASAFLHCVPHSTQLWLSRANTPSRTFVQSEAVLDCIVDDANFLLALVVRIDLSRCACRL
jgi:hypothetical protein